MDCKYPKYWNKETRLNSFHNWSFTSTKSPQELAEAGFFYTGEGDSVKCFHCGIAMYMLKRLNSCAWKLHCKFSNGKCEFLKSMKSQDFINRVMARRDEDNVTERDTSDATYQDTNKAMDCKHPKYWNKETRLNSYYNWSFDIKKSPEELAEAGFFYTGDEDKVTCFFCGLTICSLLKLNSCAWKLHCKFTDGCEYAKRIKGQTFIDNIKANMHKSNVTDRDHSDTLYQDQNKPIDCKHPKYWNKSERLKSYHNWTFNLTKAPEELADAGFFYTGENNKVKCFCCGNVLSSWTERSCLWKLHCKLPNADKCEFLKFVKGVSFITDYKTAGLNEQFGATAVNVTGTESMTRAIQSSSTGRRCEHPKYWNKSERMKTYQNWSYDFKKSFVELNDAGFFYTGDKDKVTCFSCGTSILNWKETDCVWEEHIRRYSGCDYVRSIKGQAFIDTVTRKTNPNGVKASATGGTLEDKFCKICFIEEYNVTFLPCGHVLACQNCAPCVDTCPLCRVPISSVKKIYFS